MQQIVGRRSAVGEGDGHVDEGGLDLVCKFEQEGVREPLQERLFDCLSLRKFVLGKGTRSVQESQTTGFCDRLHNDTATTEQPLSVEQVSVEEGLNAK